MLQIIQNSAGDEDAGFTEGSFEPFLNLISKLRNIEPVGRVVTSLDTLDLKTDPYLNFELRDGDCFPPPNGGWNDCKTDSNQRRRKIRRIC